MYYIYGHYLDNKCIYIGSNWKTMNKNRAYDLSDRNNDYARITNNRKHEIEVKILKEFNSNVDRETVVREEHNLIKSYHDKGEAVCSKEDRRGELNGRYGTCGKYKDSYITHLRKRKAQRGQNNPMFGKHHSEETRLKISKHKSKEFLSAETIEKLRKANSGKNNPNYGKRTKVVNKDGVNKHVSLEDVEKFLLEGWKLGMLRRSDKFE